MNAQPRQSERDDAVRRLRTALEMLAPCKCVYLGEGETSTCLRCRVLAQTADAGARHE